MALLGNLRAQKVFAIEDTSITAPNKLHINKNTECQTLPHHLKSRKCMLKMYTVFLLIFCQSQTGSCKNSTCWGKNIDNGSEGHIFLI
jgi:hypothetical protein